MQNDVSASRRHDQGFTLIELLIVVAIIAIMAAVALPNIAGYFRTYTIRGAADAVKGEIQAARSKAIMSNTNEGVSFVVVDADSYRYIQRDLVLPSGTPSERIEPAVGPLRDLPGGVVFEAASTATAFSVRFNRLGGYCNPGDSECVAAFPAVCTDADVTPRCSRGGGLDYVEPDAGSAGSVIITLHEQQTDLRISLRLAPGGRVFQQPGWESS